MEISRVADPTGSEYDMLSESLSMMFTMLDDEVLLEITRCGISHLSTRVHGIPESPEEHGKGIREVCRAIERSAAA